MLKKFKILLIASVFLFPVFLQGNEAPFQSKRVRLCLTLATKDNADTIETCLNSVRGIVDCISICDLGSTDETLEMVEQFLLTTGIPGKVYKEEFKNHAHSKMVLMQSAQKTLKEFGFSLMQTYFLVLDPDKILTIGSAFNKDFLELDAYLLLEKSSLPTYCHYTVSLLRASKPLSSLDAKDQVYKEQGRKLRTLMIEDQGNYPNKFNALQRDIALYRESLSDEHSLFCLGQAYRGLKNYEEAIKFYTERIKKGGDSEEIWFSKYMLGECYQEMGQWDHALYWYLEAYQFDSNRADPLHKVATHYRLHGQNDLAYIFARFGSRIPISNEQHLFSSPPLADYQFDEELSIISYYTRFREEGYAAANDVILRKHVPDHVKNQAYSNMQFYVQNLPNSRLWPISINLPLIQPGFDECYHPMNPSIQKTDTGYKLICRGVNYTQTGAKIFNTIDLSGVFKTKNFLVHYDKNFNLVSQQEIIEDLQRKRIRSCNVEGLEDCRIFEFKNSFWFTCTTSDTNPTGTRQISLCKLEDGEFDDAIRVEKLTPLLGPDLHRCEKNWMPFVKDNQIHVIYSCDPFIIYKVDINSGETKTVLNYEPAHDFAHFRGSAAPIAFDEGYLMLIHEVIYLPSYERYYMHRFAYTDKNFVVKKLSKPFTFKHLGIEFCPSMTIDHSEKQLILAVGVEDREAYLCFIDLNDVRSFLNPLPEIVDPLFQG